MKLLKSHCKGQKNLHAIERKSEGGKVDDSVLPMSIESFKLINYIYIYINFSISLFSFSCFETR